MISDLWIAIKTLEEDADFKVECADRWEKEGYPERANLLRAEAKGIYEALKDIVSIL